MKPIDRSISVSVNPAVRFGRPHIGGIATEAICGAYLAGEVPDVVCGEYDVDRHELAVVLWFEALYGDDEQVRKAWKHWAEVVAYPVLAGWDKTVKPEELALPEVPERNKR